LSSLSRKKPIEVAEKLTTKIKRENGDISIKKKNKHLK